MVRVLAALHHRNADGFHRRCEGNVPSLLVPKIQRQAPEAESLTIVLEVYHE